MPQIPALRCGKAQPRERATDVAILLCDMDADLAALKQGMRQALLTGRIRLV